MTILKAKSETGSVLICVLCTILILSLIAGNVLFTCITRYNVASGQVRGWKESIYAAEAGGDVAYAEIRKTVFDPTNAFSGWTNTGTGYSNSPAAFGRDNLKTSVAVDRFYPPADPGGNLWWRIRTKGIAPVLGLTRVTMDDRINTGTRGDSLLRKIDFKYDHFVAAYGPNGDNVGKAIVPVAYPQIARRIELIAAPVTPFSDTAIKASASFYGPGSAGMVDSYNSANGAYYFAANNPSDPHYSDSHSGSVALGSGTFNLGGDIWGNVSTNGGTVTAGSRIHGTIDNNVPFTIPPYVMPSNLPLPQASPNKINGNVSLTPSTAGSSGVPNYYVVSSFTGNLTVNQVGTAQTYVDIHVTGDITGSIDVKPNVHVKVYFDGNVNVKARDIVNESNIAANLQFYGISPTDPTTTQSIYIDSPGNFSATFYAPSADFQIKGNPDVIGAIVCKTFYENGNASWHYDRALNAVGDPTDYRIASYVEDMR
jgi:cytoskeletal protein CcmA (bactofilin family)